MGATTETRSTSSSSSSSRTTPSRATPSTTPTTNSSSTSSSNPTGCPRSNDRTSLRDTRLESGSNPAADARTQSVLNQLPNGAPGLNLQNGQMLERGDRGNQVRALQEAINRQTGSNLAVDGIFGPRTQAAVRQLQQQRGLEVDGIVGPQTQGCLQNWSGGQGNTANPPASNNSSAPPTQQGRQSGAANPNRQIPDFGRNPTRQQIGQQLEAAAERYGIPPNLLKAVAWQESTWNPQARSFDGGHGKGVMQIDDRYHQFARTNNVFDPRQNIDYGARYLSDLYRRTGSWDRALQRYNGGSSYPGKIRAHEQNRPWERYTGPSQSPATQSPSTNPSRPTAVGDMNNRINQLSGGRMDSVNPATGTGGSLGQRAMNWALTQEGVSESRNPDTVRGYSRGRWQAWCADFVSTAFRNAGGSPFGHQSSVQGILNWGRNNQGHFLSAAQARQNPQAVRAGDIVIWKQNGKSHTGIVTGMNPDGSYRTIEGNTSDAVRRRSYTLNDRQLTGFVRADGRYY